MRASLVASWYAGREISKALEQRVRMLSIYSRRPPLREKK
jgi:hypothetical protein